MSKTEWKFEDNSKAFLAQFKSCGLAFLEEAKSSLVSQTQRNTPGKPTGNLRRSFDDDSYVDEKNLAAYIGSSLKYAIYVEKGTGEYAIEGNGRKGYWVYVEGQESNKPPSKRKYTKQEAIETVAYLRSKGLDAHYTCGQKPKLMLYNAYIQKKDKIARMAADKFGGLGK